MTNQTNKENELIKAGYDLRAMLTFQSTEEFKRCCEIYPELSEYDYKEPSEEEVQNFINKIYHILFK